MSVKLLIDMNLSPKWTELFKKHGIDAVHWSMLGEHGAKDPVIMQWARDNGRIVFTNDLDFGTLLALTQGNSPSVIQMRTQNVLSDHWGTAVVAAIKQYDAELAKGAMIVLDDTKNRIRILPLK